MARSKPQQGRLSSFVDSLVGLVSPETALRRRALRAFEETARFGAYSGASRIEYDTRADAASADAAILPDFEDLRDRARERERNDPHVAGMVQLLADNVVGTGIRAQSRPDARALGISDREAEEWARATEDVFEEATASLDLTNRVDFYGLQRQILDRVFVDGDVFISRTSFNGPNRPVSTALELIEGDRITDPYRVKAAQRREVRAGVELGSRHQAVAYWLKLTHPDDYQSGLFNFGRTSQANDFLRLRAYTPSGQWNVLHLYRPNRPQQTRGVSHLAPALLHLQKLDDYLAAELEAKRMEACIAFVRTQSPDRAAPAFGDGPGASPLPEIQPGTVFDAFAGEDVKLLDPTRPGGSFNPFVTRILLAAGASVRIPYILLAGDYERTSYSSYRGALLDFWRHCQGWHQWLVSGFCQPVRELVIREAWLNGRLPQVDLDANPRAWLRAEWLAQKRDWVDPQKESTAEKTAMENGTLSLASTLGARGIDWETHLEQLAREKRKREQLGLISTMSIEPEETEEEAGDVDDEDEAREAEDVE